MRFNAMLSINTVADNIRYNFDLRCISSIFQVYLARIDGEDD